MTDITITREWIAKERKAIEAGYRRTFTAEIALELFAIADEVLVAREKAALTRIALTQPESARVARPLTSKSTPAGADRGELHAAAARMLAVLVRHHPAALTWHQVATLAGLKARGGHFNAGRADLRRRDLVGENDAGEVMASPDAKAADTGTWPPPETAAERLEMWCAKLPAPAPEMLRAAPDAEFWSWLRSPDGGCLVEAKDLGHGLYAGVRPLVFHSVLIVGRIGDRFGYDDCFCYATEAKARAALAAWDGHGEPAGWFRNPKTGRRRPDGDPMREYVSA